MSSFYGYNCLSIPDKGAFLSHIRRLQPRSLLFYNSELDFARQVKAEFPDMVVIYRHWPDAEIHKNISPAKWIELHEAEAAGGLYLYTENESGLDQSVIDWHMQVMDLAIVKGLHLVLLNPATGTWDTQDYARLAPLFRKAGEHRDLFIIGLHSYAGGIITSGIGGGYPGNAGIASNPNDAPGSKGKSLIPRSSWPMRNALIQDRTTLFHLGRHMWLLQYCNDNHIPMPRFALTETGFDYLGDIGAWLNTLSHTGYGSVNGWHSLKEQWHYWWGGYPDEDYVIQFKYAVENLLSGLEFALLYCYGDDGHWGNYNVANSDIPSLLESTNVPVASPAPFDYGDMNKAQIQLINARINTLNLRANPSTDSAVLRQVLDGDFVLYSQNGLKSGDFTWFKVVSAGITGFLAKTPNYDVVRVITPDTPQEPPETATKAVVVIKIPGLTIEQAQELVNNVSIQIDTDE